MHIHTEHMYICYLTFYYSTIIDSTEVEQKHLKALLRCCVVHGVLGITKGVTLD